VQLLVNLTLGGVALIAMPLILHRLYRKVRPRPVWPRRFPSGVKY
jgi:hypothetical protein